MRVPSSFTVPSGSAFVFGSVLPRRWGDCSAGGAGGLMVEVARSFGTRWLATVQTKRKRTMRSQSMRDSVARLLSIRLHFCNMWHSSLEGTGELFSRNETLSTSLYEV